MTHPSGDYREITSDLLDEYSRRLLPCPFCGRRAVVLIPPKKNRLVARCTFMGLPPCRVRPSLTAPVRVILDRSAATNRYNRAHTWIETLEGLVRDWNTRAPEGSGEVLR